MASMQTAASTAYKPCPVRPLGRKVVILKDRPQLDRGDDGLITVQQDSGLVLPQHSAMLDYGDTGLLLAYGDKAFPSTSKHPPLSAVAQIPVLFNKYAARPVLETDDGELVVAWDTDVIGWLQGDEQRLQPLHDYIRIAVLPACEPVVTEARILLTDAYQHYTNGGLDLSTGDVRQFDVGRIVSCGPLCDDEIAVNSWVLFSYDRAIYHKEHGREDVLLRQENHCILAVAPFDLIQAEYSAEAITQCLA